MNARAESRQRRPTSSDDWPASKARRKRISIGGLKVQETTVLTISDDLDAGIRLLRRSIRDRTRGAHSGRDTFVQNHVERAVGASNDTIDVRIVMDHEPSSRTVSFGRSASGMTAY